ncbi:uncharacterized protein LOC116146310 [Pistacia vera]|uniref:uncharacterized protein LOC116146310 n=1 Tax=Pistacia vera TaxID=55513 RepID=UPI00126338D2|nr:uncharacterized protein LOC116146310 [Pistacia vera]
MLRTQPFVIAILLVLSLQLFTYISYADVGTAAWHTPPFMPTTCYGTYGAEHETQFPSSNLFGTAGDGIWDNGASCGRQYLVRYISATEPNTCLPVLTIQIKIVGYALQPASPPSGSGTTIVSSQTDGLCRHNQLIFLWCFVSIMVDSLIVLDLSGGFSNKGFKSAPIGFYRSTATDAAFDSAVLDSLAYELDDSVSTWDKQTIIPMQLLIMWLIDGFLL